MPGAEGISLLAGNPVGVEDGIEVGVGVGIEVGIEDGSAGTPGADCTPGTPGNENSSLIDGNDVDGNDVAAPG
jgi:hypothetical protein